MSQTGACQDAGGSITYGNYEEDKHHFLVIRISSMKLERTLYQKSYLYFIGFFLFVLVAFWLTYFVRISEQENYRLHTHGIALILWCLMLIAQPYFIRTKRYALHRRVGTFSYLLVPLIVFTTVDLLKFRLIGVAPLTTNDYFSIALVLNALVAFVILYGLAIYFRKKPTIHARYMICTVFPLFTPVTDRIIHIHIPSLLPYLPTLEGAPITPVAGFLLADLLLIALCIWDWRSHRQLNVFPIALMILLLYHYSVLNFYKFEFWKMFSNWFVEV
ncbi:MAG TPA: hypothetical protein VK666_21095 [Chryseolinea sp.]|nr:hypothetical protein [Chryseolinea sp.]